MNYNDIDSVVGYINLTVTEHADSSTRISSLYVYGSYGNESEEPSSDLDVLVGLSNASSETIDDIRDVFKFTDNVMFNVNLDIQVVEQGSVADYLIKACRMRGYDEVYDIDRQTHVPVKELR